MKDIAMKITICLTVVMFLLAADWASASIMLLDSWQDLPDENHYDNNRVPVRYAHWHAPNPSGTDFRIWPYTWNAPYNAAGFRKSFERDHAYRVLDNSEMIKAGEIKTFFFRFARLDAKANQSIGLTDALIPNSENHFRVQLLNKDGQFGVRHAGQNLMVNIQSIPDYVYNVWVVVNNTTQTYKVYMNLNSLHDGAAGATEVDQLVIGGVDTFDFRAASNDLNRVFLHAYDGRDNDGRVAYDDLYMINGEYLGNPFEVPEKAHSPHPQNIDLDGMSIFSPIDLIWNAGQNAKAVGGQDVYVGTVFNDVANATENDQTGIYRGRQSQTLYTLPTSQLTSNTYYYWRVDQVNEDNSITTGDLWQFYIEPRNPDINQDGIVDLNDFVIVADAWLETSETEPMLADLTGDEKVWLADFAYLANFWGYYDGPAPRQVILTWQGDTATTMTISWRTDEPNPQAAILRYSDDPEAPLETYTVEVAEPFTFAPSNAVVHAVELTGLSPATEYYVVIGHPSNADTFKFRTAPDTSEEIVFLTGGDSRPPGEDTRRILNEMAAAENPAFVIFAGDLINNALSESEWDDWFDDWHEQMITDDGRRIPIIPAIGNHEVDGAYNQPKSSAPYYYNRFHLPEPESYYALTYGPDLLVVTLDSAHTTPVASQNQWLEDTLSQADDNMWKIVQYHVAAWPSNRDFNGWLPVSMRENWVPLFEQYGVDIVVEAHDHTYKLTEPIKNGEVDSDGVIYTGDGGWGAPVRSVIDASTTWWLKEAASAFHYWKFTLSADGSQLHVEPIFYGNPGSGIGAPFVLQKE